MTKRARKVQIPGEQPPTTEQSQEQTQEQAPTSDAAVQDPPAALAIGDAPNDPPAETTAPLRVSPSDKLDPVVLNATSEAPVARTGGLPDQSTVDPDTIPWGQRVLTKQGYVCSTAEPPQQPRR